MIDDKDTTAVVAAIIEKIYSNNLEQIKDTPDADTIDSEEEMAGWLDNEISAFEEMYSGKSSDILPDFNSIEEFKKYLSKKPLSYLQACLEFVEHGGSSSSESKAAFQESLKNPKEYQTDQISDGEEFLNSERNREHLRPFLILLNENEPDYTAEEMGSLALYTKYFDKIINRFVRDPKQSASWMDNEIIGDLLNKFLGSSPRDHTIYKARKGVPHELYSKYLCHLLKFGSAPFNYSDYIDLSADDVLDCVTSNLKAYLDRPRDFLHVISVIIDQLVKSSTRILKSWPDGVSLTLYRGISISGENDHPCQLKVGDCLVLKNFTSCSLIVDVARSFASRGAICNVVFIIDLKRPTPCLFTQGLSMYTKEQEIVLPPSVCLRVKKTEQKTDTDKIERLYVNCESVDCYDMCV